MKNQCDLNKTHRLITLTSLSFFLLPILSYSSSVASEEYEFNSSFLKVDDKSAVNLDYFSKGSNALPGNYQAFIYVNDKYITSKNLVIKEEQDNSTRPCITRAILAHIAFEPSRLPAMFIENLDKGGSCIDLEALIPNSSIVFDSSESRLNIQIPQVHMKRVARDSVSPELWDEGIPAALLTYNINGYNSDQTGQSLAAYFNTGVNIGGWYFRQNSVLSWSENEGSDYTIQNTYLEKAIPDWQGRVLVGQTNTQGQFFDSVPFTGIQFNTDNQMLPASQRGYAPEIRGVARTTARVTVKQDNDIIYETTVSPGEFLINDLYPTGFGGNLAVTVTEADGSEQNFLVPYAAMVQLIRPGAQHFSAAIGQYRNDTLLSNPALFEGTYQRGLSNSLTGYAGIQANQDYFSAQVGAAVGTYIGSFSADISQSFTRMLNGRSDQQGQSYEVRYSKNITSTGSDFSLAAYRFSTEGYMDYQTAMTTRDAIQKGRSTNNIYRSKNRFIVTASQQLPENWGQFYLSGSFENYWDQDGYLNQYQGGYSNHYNGYTWGMSVSRNEDAKGKTQTNLAVNLSFPLGRTDRTTGANPRVSLRLNNDDDGNERQQLSVSDSVGKDNLFNYNISSTHANKGAGTTTDVNLGYISPISSLSANASFGKHYKSQSVGLSGSLVAHAGGITASPYNGNTYALIEAKGAEGASVSGYKGIKIDSNGYALTPNLNPYQMNEVYINPKGASQNVEFTNTSQRTAPYSNAVVLVKYNTKMGIPLLFNSALNDKPVPFGASVYDAQGNTVGHVGQGGKIYARVAEPQGSLLISWGETNTEQCNIVYSLTPDQAKSTRLQSINTNCKG
ncbi:fimbria/pilus outer membrane usher protein [Vibrio algarum]|uniref:Fimbrial biogenesis outer membrane usher protein n=1 Tax=Vibrio algarum TaxID=3020714 RepID=A0ABT4YS61_9VIBR|nr:fimbria/pilus outer membrane usher protein [Vibrio sp. KJ40-1]MDB1124353.1 fimbrial biogenesis outer membrane usher protein [Vibrio sp. KJ40-1]